MLQKEHESAQAQGQALARPGKPKAKRLNRLSKYTPLHSENDFCSCLHRSFFCSHCPFQIKCRITFQDGSPVSDIDFVDVEYVEDLIISNAPMLAVGMTT